MQSLPYSFLNSHKGTFSDMTQLKLAKTTSNFLFRNFALIKKKILNQNPHILWNREQMGHLEPQYQWLALPGVKLVKSSWAGVCNHQGSFFKKNIFYWLCYYSCPIFFLPFIPLCPAAPLPPAFPSLSSCSWVVHIRSLASPFPILILTSPCLFSAYHLCFLFPVPILSPPQNSV